MRLHIIVSRDSNFGSYFEHNFEVFMDYVRAVLTRYINLAVCVFSLQVRLQRLREMQDEYEDSGPVEVDETKLECQCHRQRSIVRMVARLDGPE